MQLMAVPVIRRATAVATASLPHCSNRLPPLIGQSPLRPCAPHVLSPQCRRNITSRQTLGDGRQEESRDGSPASDLAYQFAFLASAAAGAAVVGANRRECSCDYSSQTTSRAMHQRRKKNATNAMIKNHEFIYTCTHLGNFEDIYTLEKEIGKGAFGVVCLARHKEMGHRRAVKKIVKKPDEDPGQLDDLKREIHALMDLDHPNIVKLIRYFDEGPAIYLVFQLCEGPNLLQLFKEVFDTGEVFSEETAADILRQMLQAVKGCHNNYMGHFDVKPENFMYLRADRRNRLMMIDLGLSSRFKHDDQTICGTAEYMAPEVWDGVYGPEADIWSCGAVLFAMLTGTPFIPQNAEEEEIISWVHDRSWVRQRLRLAQSQGISPKAFDLLSSMLRHNRHQRPTAREALCHPFLADYYHVALCKAGKDVEIQHAAEGVLERLLSMLHTFATEPVLKRACWLVMAHLAAYGFKEAWPQRLAFSILDRHADGELSIEALEAHYLKVCGKIPENLESDFSGVDVDDDGCITYAEFLSVTLPDSIRFNEKLLSAVFNFLDRDKDGTIDDDDLVTAFRNGHDPDYLCSMALAEVCDDSRGLSREQFLTLMRQPLEQTSAELPGRGDTDKNKLHGREPQ